MKTNNRLLLLLVVAILLSSCSSGVSKESQMKQTIDSLSLELKKKEDVMFQELKKKDSIIFQLKDSIEMLSFPASQRLEKAIKLIEEGNTVAAECVINDIKRIFPNSKEAITTDKLLEKIASIEEQKKKEEERKKALGFKALKQNTTIVIDYNKVVLSNITIGNRFTFDAYGDEWFYRDADRGYKYVTMSMSVTSESRSPKIPEFAIYKIKGDEMYKEGVFTTEYARWSDYGSYLGNYHDNQNDFAKVSTVKFKLGCEVDEELIKQPFAIVVKKQNLLKEEYDRYKNPPKYWTGTASYPYSLKLSSFDVDYGVVKIFNLK